MRFDFWNNPLVVTAIRLKYRRSSPVVFTCLYALSLVGLGGLLQHYSANMPIAWVRIYLIVVLALQFLVSMVFAAMRTATSMNAEINSRTLDFQRLVALSPREILLGKMLGEPAQVYLLAIAVFPLAWWCCLMGAASLWVLLLIYLQLIASTLLAGSMGLPLSFDPPAAKKEGTSQGRPGNWILLLVLMGFLPQLVIHAVLAQNTWINAVLGLITPIPILRELAMPEGPWHAQIGFFGLEIPFLLVAPLAQLALAGLFFGTAVRKFVNSHNPLLSKAKAYALMIAVDAFVAGVAFNRGPVAGDSWTTAVVFCAAHLVAGLFLVSLVTPSREALLSWIWRYRGRTTWVRDAAWGDRSENTVVLVGFALIGLAGFFIWVALPAHLAGDAAVLAGSAPRLAVLLAVSQLLLLALGVAYQWFLLFASRPGKIAYLLLIGLLWAMPAIVGGYYQIDELLAASPLTYYVSWVVHPSNPLPSGEIVGIYGLILVLAIVGLRRRVRQHVERVAAKLREMQV